MALGVIPRHSFSSRNILADLQLSQICTISQVSAYLRPFTSAAISRLTRQLCASEPPAAAAESCSNRGSSPAPAAVVGSLRLARDGKPKRPPRHPRVWMKRRPLDSKEGEAGCAQVSPGRSRGPELHKLCKHSPFAEAHRPWPSACRNRKWALYCRQRRQTPTPEPIGLYNRH